MFEGALAVPCPEVLFVSGGQCESRGLHEEVLGNAFYCPE